MVPKTRQNQSQLCHELASEYWSRLKQADLNTSCPLQKQRENLITSAESSSSANYHWQHKNNVLELGIGLTCCPKPEEKELRTVWERVRPALVGLLNRLQGIHVFVSNLDGREARVTIAETNLSLGLGPEGHLWHLMSDGAFTITLKVEGFMPMTKLVRVFAAEFTEVNFDLPYPSGMPRAVTLLILSSVVLVAMLCMLAVQCRRSPQIGPKRPKSYEGFQLLSREEQGHIFEDMDDDDEMEDFFDKGVQEFGLKMPPSKVYRDFTSSEEEDQEEDLEDFLKIPRTTENNEQLGQRKRHNYL